MKTKIQKVTPINGRRHFARIRAMLNGEVFDERSIPDSKPADESMRVLSWMKTNRIAGGRDMQLPPGDRD